MSPHSQDRKDIEEMAGLIGSDPGDSIDIGTDNHLNVDAIVTAAALPPLVLPGGYVPKIPNPLPKGPHPMMERAYAAHENRLAHYNGKRGLPHPETPTPKLIAQRPRRRSGIVFIAEMLAMFMLFAIQLVLFAPLSVARAATTRPAPKASPLPRMEAPHYGVPARTAPARRRSSVSPIEAFMRGLFRPVTPLGIGIWMSVTGVLALMQGMGVITL